MARRSPKITLEEISGHTFPDLETTQGAARLQIASDLAVMVRKRLPPDKETPFYSVNTYHQSFQFYLGRTTTMVAYQDELSFGIRQEPQKFIPDIAGFVLAWRQAPSAWAIMPQSTWAQLRAQGLPMREVARDSRRIVVRKP